MTICACNCFTVSSTTPTTINSDAAWSTWVDELRLKSAGAMATRPRKTAPPSVMRYRILSR